MSHKWALAVSPKTKQARQLVWQVQLTEARSHSQTRWTLTISSGRTGNVCCAYSSPKWTLEFQPTPSKPDRTLSRFRIVKTKWKLSQMRACARSRLKLSLSNSWESRSSSSTAKKLLERMWNDKASLKTTKKRSLKSYKPSKLHL